MIGSDLALEVTPSPERGVLRTAAVAAALTLVCTLATVPGGAQELDSQLQEIRTLVREKRYPLALESLRLIALQIQDLRLEVVAPAFPEPPAGWNASRPLSLLEEDEIWTDRIAAQRTYNAQSGTARMEITIDLHSPLGPVVALSFNPLAIAADPQSRLVEVGGEKGRLVYNPATGEGELRVLLGRETLVTAAGRGIFSAETLLDLARRVDYALLRARQR